MKTLEEILAFAKHNYACESQLKPFENFVKFRCDQNTLLAWQTVYGNIEWLTGQGLKLDVERVKKLAYGEAKRWYKNGMLLYHKTVNQEVKYWYQSGQLRYHETPNGEIKRWYEDGQLEYQRSPNGTTVSWFKNGEPNYISRDDPYESSDFNRNLKTKRKKNFSYIHIF